MQKEIDTTVAAWSQYKRFAEERDELARTLWDVMRNKVHQIEDFVSKWTKDGEGMEVSSMKLTLLRELGSYRMCVHTFMCWHLSPYLADRSNEQIGWSCTLFS
jgi:hypothetical protein